VPLARIIVRKAFMMNVFLTGRNFINEGQQSRFEKSLFDLFKIIKIGEYWLRDHFFDVLLKTENNYKHR
jgi:hypothetical protein